jgi:chromate transporter
MKIGAFSFGGGYAVISFIQKEIIENNAWISARDFIDIVAIAEMTPGPIAVNSATFVGYKIASVAGSIAGTIGVILVPFLVTLLVSIYYNRFRHLKQISWILKGIRPAVIGLIAAACFKIAKDSILDVKGIIIALSAFITVYKFKLHPILAILLSGIMGYILYGMLPKF